MKKVILITTGDILAGIACEKLLEFSKISNFKVIAAVDSNVSFSRSIRVLQRAIKEEALFYILYMFIETYGLKIVNCLYRIFKIFGLKLNYKKGLFESLKKANIPVMKIKNINSYDSIGKIRALSPDLILCIRPNQILRKRFITSFQRILNLHCSLLPKYRGIGSVFQALANGESGLGCSVHIIDSESIDAGPIVTQDTLLVDRSHSLLSCTIKLYKKAQELLVKAIDSQENNDYKATEGSYFSWPKKIDLQNFLSLKLKIFNISDFKYFVKS